MTSALTKEASAPVTSVTKETKSKASTSFRKRKAPNKPPAKREVHSQVDASGVYVKNHNVLRSYVSVHLANVIIVK